MNELAVRSFAFKPAFGQPKQTIVKRSPVEIYTYAGHTCRRWNVYCFIALLLATLAAAVLLTVVLAVQFTVRSLSYLRFWLLFYTFYDDAPEYIE